jgi:hypothetical protein
MRKAYIATIQVCIEGVNNDAEAVDWISGLLSGDNPKGLVDWQYLKLGGQWLYPTEQYIPDTKGYREGDCFIK